ncbi:MAG: YceD family protein [Pseudomonadota bacterium]|jgi:uncharacterized protein
MSQQGAVIDSLEFARQGGHLTGCIAPGELVRLADVLSDDDGELQYVVTGETDGNGKPFLTVAIDGSINLRCQRCLGPLTYTVRVRSRLAQVEPGEEWPGDELENDSFDAMPSERALDVVGLCEDEILLALAIAPRHESCAPPEYEEKAESQSPFASLARLKRGQRN